MKHYQVCFTRIGGQGSGDGWQSVNESPELQPEAITSFTRIQNANVNQSAFDEEDMRNQTVTELQNDSGFVFLTRIKYGLKDQTGRPSMFAHCFVFNVNEFIAAPQSVLRIENDNFHFDIQRTQNPPEQLRLAAEETLSGAMSGVGMDKKVYSSLMQCVYYVLDNKAKAPLYVICDCEPATIRRILLCVYSALPFEFRRKISFTTCDGQSGAVKTLIFKRRVKKDNSNYFAVNTGDNNVLNESVLKRWERYGFMTAVPNNMSRDPDGYFKALEDKLTQFGSAQTTSLDLYKIAHDLCEGDVGGTAPLSADALASILNEYLSVPVNHPFLDRQIVRLLKDIISSGVALNGTVSEKLAKKLETTQLPELIQAGFEFNSGVISRMSAEEGAKYLRGTFGSGKSAPFMKIRALLERDEKGRAIVSRYYADIAVSMPRHGKERILDFYRQTMELFDRREVQESLSRLCIAYLKQLVGSSVSPEKMLHEAEELLNGVLSDREDLIFECRTSFIEEFWDKFKFGSFRFECCDLYESIFLPGNSNSRLAEQLIKCFRFFEEKRTAPFHKLAYLLLMKDNAPFPMEVRIVLIERLQRICLSMRSIFDDYETDIWLVLAFLGSTEKSNPVEFLLENNIEGITVAFDVQYEKSEFLSDREYRQRFMEYLSNYSMSRQKGYTIARYVLRVMKEREKQAKQNIKLLAKHAGGQTDNKRNVISRLIDKINRPDK